MPTLTVTTNVATDKVPASLSSQLVNAVAKSLGKPVSYVVVLINAGANLNWGDSSEPAAICSLGSIGAISRDKNKVTSKVVMDILNSGLGIAKNRQYLVFSDLAKENVGYDGTTFDDLL